MTNATILAGIVLVTSLAACAKPPAAEAPAAGVSIAPPEAPAAPHAADGLSEEFHEGFTAADTRARAIAYWMQCTSTVARLRAGGTFGAANGAPRALYCERTVEGVPVGGVYDIDSGYRTVRRLTMVRLDGARPRFTDPLDTARIAREARLVRDVTRTVSPIWSRRNRPFTVIPVAIDTTVEAWVLPRATRGRSFVTGGDIGYAANADGTLRVVADRTGTWTQLTLPSNGPLTIYSSVRDIPAIADLVTARYQTDLGRTVQVSTPLAVSALVAGLDSTTGARVIWKHTRR